MTTRRGGIRAAIAAAAVGLLLGALAPAASAATMERGKDTWSSTATDDVFCGIVMSRVVEGQGSWMARYDDAGDLTYWHGTLNVTVDLTNAENGRTIRLRSSGIDREVHASTDTFTVYAAGTGLWGTAPGRGKVSGVAGLGVIITVDGTEVDYQVHGSFGDETEMCAYLAGV